MEQLIQSSDLFVMQVEMDVYTALKKVAWKHDSQMNESSLPKPVSEKFFVIFSPPVDVPAAQPIMGRSH